MLPVLNLYAPHGVAPVVRVEAAADIRAEYPIDGREIAELQLREDYVVFHCEPPYPLVSINSPVSRPAIEAILNRVPRVRSPSPIPVHGRACRLRRRASADGSGAAQCCAGNLFPEILPSVPPWNRCRAIPVPRALHCSRASSLLLGESFVHLRTGPRLPLQRVVFATVPGPGIEDVDDGLELALQLRDDAEQDPFQG